MTEEFDSETGEVVEGLPNAYVEVGMRMPVSIAKAVIAVMKETGQLGYDDRNEHGRYSFASIDKFLKIVGPICAKHGLIILMDENESTILKTPNERGGESSWLKMTYHVNLYAADGSHFGPLTRRSMVPAIGAQAFGSAESYVLKRFMRNLFQIATGEKDDADRDEGRPLPDQGRKSPPVTVERLKQAQAPEEQQPSSPAPAGNGQAPSGHATREEALKWYAEFRAGVAEAPHKTALDSLVAEWTRNKRLGEIKYWGDKAYQKCMEAIQARAAMFDAPKDGEFPGELPA